MSDTCPPAISALGLFDKTLHTTSRSIHPERYNWEVVQESLDLYMQRLAASADRQLMRDWYELVLEVGNSLFTSSS